MNKKDFFYQYAEYLIVALIILPFLLFAENSKYSRFKNFIRECGQKQKAEEVEKVFTEEELLREVLPVAGLELAGKIQDLLAIMGDEK